MVNGFSVFSADTLDIDVADADSYSKVVTSDGVVNTSDK